MFNWDINPNPWEMLGFLHLSDSRMMEIMEMMDKMGMTMVEMKETWSIYGIWRFNDG